MLAPNAGISVLSIPATQSILSPNVLLKFKCQLLTQQRKAQGVRPVIPKRTAQKRSFDMTARQSLLTSLPFKPNYSPLKWAEPTPAGMTRSASGNNLVEADSFSGLPPFHPSASSAQFEPTFDEDDHGFLNLSDLPSQLPRSPYTPMEPIKSEPFSPDAPYASASYYEYEASYPVKQEAIKQEHEAQDYPSGLFDERPLVVKLENEHEEEPAEEMDAAMKVAMVLVKAHEAGYEMDSLTTQIQIAMLRQEPDHF